MKAAPHKILVPFLSLVMLLAAALAAWFQEAVLLLIPFVLFGMYLLLQYPVYAFYLLVATIPWSVEYHFSASLGTDLPDEPLMLVCSAAALAWWTYTRNKPAKLSLHPLLAVITLEMLWIGFTLPQSTGVLLSVKYLLAKSWYLLAFLILPIFLFRRRQVLTVSAKILLVSMLVSMTVALVRHGINGFSFAMVNPSLSPFYRNHVNYSSILVCMVPLEIAFLRNTSANKKNWLLGALAVTIAAIILSYARGAWLALLLGIFSYWLIRRRLLFLSFLIFVLLTISSLLWLEHNDEYLQFSNDFKTTIFHKNFEQHLVATYKMKDLSTAERFYRWVAAARMSRDGWLTGFGPNTFYDNYKRYTLPAFRTWVSDNKEHSTVHNYFLLLLAEQGVIGLFLFLLLLAAAFWYAQRRHTLAVDSFERTASAAVGAILVMICTINFLSDMIETDKVGSLFYVCIAVLITLDGGNAGPKKSRTDERLRS